MIHNFRSYLFSSGRVQLLDHLRLMAQLCGLERRTARSGRDSVDHGPGANQHDDLANAAAGALVLAAQGTGTDEVFAANLRDTPRTRILDEREFELLGRGDY
jgi:hypothetical protein